MFAVANSCDIDKIANAAAHADYSSCDKSGSCTPTCKVGYDVTTPASNTMITCDENGGFDGTNSLVCTGVWSWCVV